MPRHIDLQSLKQRLDLLALAGRHTTLRRVAATGGGEWAGPCPFCGGSDRFRVQPQGPGGGRWLCRQCSGGRWQDAIAFGQRLWPELSFRQVCEQLAGGDLPLLAGGEAGPARPPETPAYQPPAAAWQAAARQAVDEAARRLWEAEGAPARDYLARRGLSDETLRAWQIGWSPGARYGEAALWVPRGVLIPCLALGEVWYLKIALLPGQAVKCEKCRRPAAARQPCPACGAVNKYRGVKGNRPAAIYGADDLRGAQMALFVEGEFDCLVAWQELRDVISVCTLGSATNRPDLAVWGPFLAPLELILTTYDADAAGRGGAAALAEMNERVRACPLPEGVKDINEYYLAGGALWPWLKAGLKAG